jgi:hypothetical protein
MPNVFETAAYWDTIIICSSLYGNEATAPGWFTTMAGFGAQQEHRFFKNRNQAMVGLAYNNMLSQDRSDYPFRCVSLGLTFFAPCTPFELVSGEITRNRNLASFFTFDLPNHVGVSFRLGQDIRVEGNAYHFPPGYGPRVGGTTQGQDEMPAGPPQNPTISNLIWSGTQGNPVIQNRYVFEQEINIPRNETFEVKITLSEYARVILADCAGPGSYEFQLDEGEGPSITEIPVRYGIQCSLYGVREVQQRGAAHA